MATDKIPVMTYKEMEFLMNAISLTIPKDCSFFILVAPDGDPKTHNRAMNYGSSMPRECTLNLMKEWMIKNGSHEEWMEHLDDPE